jgi:hypothetical protein
LGYALRVHGDSSIERTKPASTIQAFSGATQVKLRNPNLIPLYHLIDDDNKPKKEPKTR